MKKLLFLSFILVSVNCFSQGFGKGIVSRLTFGVKGGANYSDFSGANFETEGLVGFHGGALVNFKISDHFSIEEDFLFSYQGAKTKNNLFGDKTVKMYYLAVPIMLKYRPIGGLYLELGTQSSILLKKVDATVDGKFAKPIDMGVAAGIGYQTKSGLGLGVRYIAGLTKVGDFQSSTVKSDFKSAVAQASIFYTF